MAMETCIAIMGRYPPQVLTGSESNAWIQDITRATNPADSSGSGSAHCAGLIHK